ncbi:MAG: hypothetical protein CVU00_07700 [Bacteroidetes bacterium HGW-Bacteroidetes-17]|nr:MAG: hypothetical protein CVU00_07700 [Bacteroidetes bacterium HGW-Bacteroidetes-17]
MFKLLHIKKIEFITFEFLQITMIGSRSVAKITINWNSSLSLEFLFSEILPGAILNLLISPFDLTV